MKVVIAIDSFKGSISSSEAGQAAKAGILQVFGDAEVKVIPLADGGEGTIDALIEGMSGTREVVEVAGPLNEKVFAHYGILKDGRTAIIEMAQASGLPLVPVKLRNPLNTTTYGVGEVIKAAIAKGCRDFIIGIGGSATNDAGVGMLQALGVEFFDKDGNAIGLGGRVLNSIATFNTDNILPELKECLFNIACDVNNPLFGLNGAAHIYGTQKGATPEMIEELDMGLKSFAKVVKTELNIDTASVAGVGAAGGLGYAFKTFMNAKLESGVDIIIKATRLEEHLKKADFVITGEGKIDHQTSMGKGPIGVAKLAKKYKVKVIGFAGAVADNAVSCNDEGMDAYFSIQTKPVLLEEAMAKENATKNLTLTVTQIFKLIRSISK